jgi:hypothetical protein
MSVTCTKSAAATANDDDEDGDDSDDDVVQSRADLEEAATESAAAGKLIHCAFPKVDRIRNTCTQRDLIWCLRETRKERFRRHSTCARRYFVEAKTKRLH